MESIAQRDNQEVWEASLRAIHETPEGKRPQLLDQFITTVPPNSQEPEQISLHRWTDSSWSDTTQVLTLDCLTRVAQSIRSAKRM